MNPLPFPLCNFKKKKVNSAHRTDFSCEAASRGVSASLVVVASQRFQLRVSLKKLELSASRRPPAPERHPRFQLFCLLVTLQEVRVRYRVENHQLNKHLRSPLLLSAFSPLAFPSPSFLPRLHVAPVASFSRGNRFDNFSNPGTTHENSKLPVGVCSPSTTKKKNPYLDRNWPTLVTR